MTETIFNQQYRSVVAILWDGQVASLGESAGSLILGIESN